MSEVTEFKVSVDPVAITDLKKRLALTRWPEAETVDDWSQGVPLAWMQDITEYWLNTYDHGRLEARLSQYPNFRTSIDGLGVHFMHIRSSNPDALPVILTHGWPGSVLEFMKVIGPLTEPQNHGGDIGDAFHVVCPSLPGYGFSDKPTGTGWGIEKTGAAWGKLMARLGYNSYVAQGGDWGAIVTTAVGVADPEHCRAIHLNMVIAPPDPDNMSDLTDAEQSAMQGLQYYQQWDSGYSKQQSTRPQTIGYSLVDSPVGQAAWILEKFWAWTDCDGNPENVLSRDEMLDNVMLYWLTGAGASSARLYWESFGNAATGDTLTIPMGGSIFPKEIFRTSKRWADKRFSNIIYWNVLDKGGHFAAFEQPETYINEVRECFRQCR